MHQDKLGKNVVLQNKALRNQLWRLVHQEKKPGVTPQRKKEEGGREP